MNMITGVNHGVGHPDRYTIFGEEACTCGARAVTTAVLLQRPPPLLHPAVSRTPPPSLAPQARRIVRLLVICGSAVSRRWQVTGDRWQVTGRAGMAGAAAPKRQDTRKFFENLSGAGKSIAVLTSGGDAQGTVLLPLSDTRSINIRHFLCPYLFIFLFILTRSVAVCRDLCCILWWRFCFVSGSAFNWQKMTGARPTMDAWPRACPIKDSSLSPVEQMRWGRVSVHQRTSWIYSVFKCRYLQPTDYILMVLPLYYVFMGCWMNPLCNSWRSHPRSCHTGLHGCCNMCHIYSRLVSH